MPCYNAAKYLEKSVDSVLKQRHTKWELVIVNDGSTDESEKIALRLASTDERITVVSKENGGYVSARLHGYKKVSASCKYLLFYDADDKLHPDMLSTLAAEMEQNAGVGAVYCDHLIMDEEDNISREGINMPRSIPTALWVKILPDDIKYTPFISIFCWTKMIEPMTLIRRAAYDDTIGWDPDFGKGQGNIGDGVYLFSEIALKWKIRFVNKPLYYYRRHPGQSSAVSSSKMQEQANKVINKWRERINSGFGCKQKLTTAIIYYRYRLSAYHYWHSLPHEIRYRPLAAIKLSAKLVYEYLRSLPLIFTYRRLVD